MLLHRFADEVPPNKSLFPGLEAHCRKFCVCWHFQRLGRQVDAMFDMTAESRASELSQSE